MALSMPPQRMAIGFPFEVGKRTPKRSAMVEATSILAIPSTFVPARTPYPLAMKIVTAGLLKNFSCHRASARP
jgi:hypothetical protein